jgi:hypothetical protein
MTLKISVKFSVKQANHLSIVITSENSWLEFFETKIISNMSKKEMENLIEDGVKNGGNQNFY